VQIQVVDHGLGIPADQIGRLFQKFERVRTEQHCPRSAAPASASTSAG
jgi:signal transduction histidine kinase